MKTLKLIALTAFALLFSQCKTTAPTEPSGSGTSVYEVIKTLDTVRGKFYDFAQAHLSSTPQQILVMTADWVKTQPNVVSATWFDSSYIDITMKSGLRTTYAIYIYGSDSLSLTRGGGQRTLANRNLTPSVQANHKIVNKSVLIYSPFVGRVDHSLYNTGEILPLVNKIRNSGKGVSVTLLENDNCTVEAIESFKNYGIVILDTHGFPDCFYSGDKITGLSIKFDTTDAIVKEYLDAQITDGYNKIVNGDFRFALDENIGNIIDWQKFLKKKTDDPSFYRILVNSQFLDKLPLMSHTIIVGNMCYSGWSRAGLFQDQYRGVLDYSLPIKTAFTNRNPIAYYSYGFTNQLSAPVDNEFAKKMEDTLLRSLIIDGDSTGNAYLNTSNQQFTAEQTGDHITPLMPFTLTGAKDYSFDECVSVFTDNRDGSIYKAVCIGDQNWMAENLKYNAPGSLCYDNNPANCDTYGRLYSWDIIMAGAAASNTNPSKVHGICPNGWHLPSKDEWTELVTTLGGEVNALPALMATKLWDNPVVIPTNSSGFNALAAGYYDRDQPITQYRQMGSGAFFWSTTDNGVSGKKTGFNLSAFANKTFIIDQLQTLYFSCRCVKDK